jgi:hypothetical protein
LFHPQTTNPDYWTSHFSVTPSDIEFIYNLFLEKETPLKTPELIQHLIEFRVESEFRRLQKFQEKGDFFRPSQTYAVGQEVIFPAFDFAKGKIVALRAGENPNLGAFQVATVEFETGETRQVATELAQHKLNGDLSAWLDWERPSPEQIYQRYKRPLTQAVVDRLREDSDMLFIAKRWFLKSLLLEVNMGVLNLAEAVLDMHDGGPVQTLQIAEEIDFGQDANPILRSVSLDYMLMQDERFDEVGPAGQVLWFLRRFEPADILTPPPLLHYDEVAYDPQRLQADLREMEESIDDELALSEVNVDEESEVAYIPLLYPHWRSGTLPLTQRAEHLFPIAYRTPRILITLVDAKTKEESRGWVVRDYDYVFGLADFYKKHNLPIGAIISVRPDPDDPSRIWLDYQDYKPRNEWLYIARVEDNRLRFVEGQRPIGAVYDDLLTLWVEDPAALDAFGTRYRRPHSDLKNLMREVMSELIQISHQHHVHCKTLYSAVNLVRRCPPGLIFTYLQTDPTFQRAGGPYWRLAD